MKKILRTHDGGLCMHGSFSSTGSQVQAIYIVSVYEFTHLQDSNFNKNVIIYIPYTHRALGVCANARFTNALVHCVPFSLYIGI